jgi:hypothetical protein
VANIQYLLPRGAKDSSTSLSSVSYFVHFRRNQKRKVQRDFECAR